MVRVYDRPLLRSSARANGAFPSNIRRFATRFEEPRCEHPGYVTGERNAGVTVSRSDQASVRRGPRVFDPEERSNGRSKRHCIALTDALASRPCDVQCRPPVASTAATVFKVKPHEWTPATVCRF